MTILPKRTQPRSQTNSLEKEKEEEKEEKEKEKEDFPSYKCPCSPSGEQREVVFPIEQEIPRQKEVAEPSEHRRLVRSTEFLKKIESYLATDYLQEHDYVLTNIGSTLFSLFERRFLRTNDKLRYSYDGPTRTLILRGMQTPIHSAITKFLNTFYYTTLLSSLTPSEVRHVDLSVGTDVPLPGDRRKSGLSSVRQPDAAFEYQCMAPDGSWRPDPYPRVVFEVAFSQRYEKLVEVTREWLVRSQGRVKLVVAIKITEGPIVSGGTAAAGTESGGGPQVGGEQDLERDEVGSATENNEDQHDNDDDDGDSPRSSRFSSPGEVEVFHASVDTSQWVGPLTATLELFRYDPGRPEGFVRDGPQYTILPPPNDSSQPDPILKISDLLRDTEGDDRTIKLPLELYREYILKSIRNTALLRRMQRHNERKRARGDDNDGEFAEVAQEGERDDQRVKRTRMLRAGPGESVGEVV